jgi:hypothetical protein
LCCAGKDGRETCLSDCQPGDMHAYWRLTDYVFKQIENSTCKVSIYTTARAIDIAQYDCRSSCSAMMLDVALIFISCFYCLTLSF